MRRFLLGQELLNKFRGKPGANRVDGDGACGVRAAVAKQDLGEGLGRIGRCPCAGAGCFFEVAGLPHLHVTKLLLESILCLNECH